MPNRILREGILSSERVARLGWAEEVFYRRLMSVVDDFGRYHANPKLLRAALYPLLIDKVSDADIGKWLTSCVTAALVSVYPAPDGKRYLQLLDFRQQARADKSKYPPMPDGCIADATQTHIERTADAPVFGYGDVIEDGGEKARKRATLPCPDDVSPNVWADWLALRKAKRAPVTATTVEGAIAEAKAARMTLDAFLREWCARGSQGLKADWLKPNDRGRPEPSATVAHNPQVDATQALLRERAEHAAKSTPPPASLLAMVGKAARIA
jgi:hypothetical protein